LKTLKIFDRFCYNILRGIFKEKGGPKMNAIYLSKYVVSLFEDRDAPITNLKLQKVLY